MDAVCLYEKGLADSSIERFNACGTLDNEKPCFSFRFQAPSGVWW